MKKNLLSAMVVALLVMGISGYSYAANSVDHMSTEEKVYHYIQTENDFYDGEAIEELAIEEDDGGYFYVAYDENDNIVAIGWVDATHLDNIVEKNLNN